MTFTNTPCKLIGERQRGLITYVMALMNGARLGIAAQSLGVAEAASRLAREYAASREQFGAPIEKLAPVAEMISDMRIQIEAGRALAYETARVCDIENNTNRLLERAADTLDPAEAKEMKKTSRQLKKLNSMLTPMSKFYCSEMSIRVANDAIQVMGGSGYMKDYPAERYARDARITTIYEGTSQLQVVAAIRGLTSGAFGSYLDGFEATVYEAAELEELKAKLKEARALLDSAIAQVKGMGSDYLDLSARKLVESGVVILIGHYFLGQAAKNDYKKKVASYWIATRMPLVRMNCEKAMSGNSQAIDDYLDFAGC